MCLHRATRHCLGSALRLSLILTADLLRFHPGNPTIVCAEIARSFIRGRKVEDQDGIQMPGKVLMSVVSSFPMAVGGPQVSVQSDISNWIINVGACGLAVSRCGPVLTNPQGSSSTIADSCYLCGTKLRAQLNLNSSNATGSTTCNWAPHFSCDLSCRFSASRFPSPVANSLFPIP